MYVNGIVLFDTNLPPGVIDATTQATSILEAVVDHTYSTLTAIFSESIDGQFIFAIELLGQLPL